MAIWKYGKDAWPAQPIDSPGGAAQASSAMRVAESIRVKLEAAFQPERLIVEDESHRHAGHAGARPEGETHFHVTMVSAVFDGVSRIDRQRRVHQVLAEELKGPVHALALTLKAPTESR